MFPLNLFSDICSETTSLRKCCQKLNVTFNETYEYSIINLDASSGQNNKMSQTFLWHIHDYYQDSGYVFDILKKQHYQTLIISLHKNQQECFVGGVLYVICPIEGSLVLFLHIAEEFRSIGIGILLLQLVQKVTRMYLKSNKMLVWIEVSPSSGRDISSYYKKIGFNITSPTKHNIQHLVPDSLLTLINDLESYNHIMECHEPITKQNQISKNISKFHQSSCDMCNSSPCVMVCEQGVEKSHNILEKSVRKKPTKTEICGTKLCVKCQMGFGLTYKHRCVVHSHRAKATQNNLITDGTYQSFIKKFLIDSTEKSTKKSKNNSKFWNDPYNVSKLYKYCRHCRIYDVKEAQSKEYMECCENLCVRVNNKTSLHFMTTHVNDMMFFNITKDLGLHENRQCLQYPEQHHSHYLDSNLGSVKSLVTNTFFGLKDVVGAGDCGFLCLMVAINSDENVSRWFDNAVQEFNKKVGNNVKKTQSSLPITQLIGKFQKFIFPFSYHKFKKLLGER